MAKLRNRANSRVGVGITEGNVARQLVSDIAAALAEFHESLQPPRLPRRWRDVQLRRFRAPQHVDSD